MMRRWLRRRLARRPDDGLSLAEMLVAMMVFAMAMAMITGALIATLHVTKGAQSASDAEFEARQALAIIDRQVRSGNVLFSPADEVTYLSSCHDLGGNSGDCMRIYTQSNGDEKCVQWQLVPDPSAAGTYQLQMRSWTSDWQTTGKVTAWAVNARGLLLSGSPFTLDVGNGGLYGQRLLKVHLVSKNVANGHNVTIDASISGRNTTYGYSGSQCLPVPPG